MHVNGFKKKRKEKKKVVSRISRFGSWYLLRYCAVNHSLRVFMVYTTLKRVVSLPLLTTHIYSVLVQVDAEMVCLERSSYSGA